MWKQIKKSWLKVAVYEKLQRSMTQQRSRKNPELGNAGDKFIEFWPNLSTV